MKNRQKNIFSLSLQSLTHQLNRLFDEAGGQKAIEALDALSALPAPVQEKLLDSLMAIIEKINSGKSNLESISSFEKELFTSIVKDAKVASLTLVKESSKPASARVLEFPQKRAL